MQADPAAPASGWPRSAKPVRGLSRTDPSLDDLYQAIASAA
jgi:hypothetical protein